MSIDTQAFRERLVAQQQELEELLALAEAGARPVELQQETVGRLSRMDAIQQQQMAIANKARLQQQLVRTRQALVRIEEGEFGYCQDCGREIAPQRLDLDPSVALCINCAR